MMRTSSWVIPAALAAMSALYFALGSDLSLDWIDEGQILYFSSRVADGALPYRDFQNIYGPSVFLLNGGLMAVFGKDVLVIRALVVVLKSALAVFVYLCGARLGSRPLAASAWLATVALIGLPWPYFTTPYANYYALAISMGALVFFVSSGSSLVRRCFLAGLGLGIAATFKQTNGLFPVLALFLYLTSLRQLDERDTSNPPHPFKLLFLRIVRWIGMLTCLGIFAAYLAHGGTLWQSFVLASPISLLVGWLMLRELRDPPGEAVSLGVFRAHAWLALGAGLPGAAVVAGYASLGLVDELAFNTLMGLPQLLDWFVPVPSPGWSTLLFVVALGATLSAVFVAGGGVHHRGRRRLTMAMIALVAVGAAVWLLLRSTRTGTSWVSDSIDLFIVVPYALVWLATVLVLRAGLRATARIGRNGVASADASLLLLFTLFGAVSLLYYHPAADAPHVMMSAPAILPLMVPCLRAISRDRAPWPAVAIVCALCFPFVQILGTARHSDRIERNPIERATDIRVGGPLYRDGARLVRYLDNPSRASRPVFVASGKLLIYFLTDRASPVDHEEFAFYLTGLGVIEDADANRLVNEREVVLALRAARPLIVTDEFDAATARFARAFPLVWSEIEAATYVEKELGGFHVRDWNAPIRAAVPRQDARR